MTIRFAGLALLFTTVFAAAAAAQTAAPSATPTNGAVGSAAQRNGYPAAGGAVALPAIGPSIANSSTTTTTPLAGTTTSPALSSRRPRHYRPALAAAPPLAARDRPAAMAARVFPEAPVKRAAARAVPILGAEIPPGPQRRRGRAAAGLIG